MRRTVTPGLTYDALKQLALALPEVQESTSYGTPALKLRGKLMVRLKEDGETVVLRSTWDERERVMTLYPDAFHVTDHYRDHPWVLLRLSTAPPASVAHALDHAWRLVASKALLAGHPPPTR